MARDLVSQDVEEIVGTSHRLDDGLLACSTCAALVADDWLVRLRHAEWHVEQGHARLPGS